MILKPRKDDIKIICFYLGKVIFGLGLTMLLPLVLAVILKEAAPAVDFLIAVELTLVIGFLFENLFKTNKGLNWMQGMIVVSLSWLVAMLLGAIPMYLSGHWKSYLDACFDSMSGFATTGLSLAQDLDHLSYSHNLWR
ncbi:MAG: TrkH family potassium uptake protein, partial [Candidatus Omnitrophota bacterium]